MSDLLVPESVHRMTKAGEGSRSGEMSGIAKTFVALAAAVVWTQACGSAPPLHSPDPGSLRIATWDPDGGGNVAGYGVTGSLSGMVNGDGTACFYVDTTSVGGAARYVLVWPKGYSARDDPLRVVDTAGRTVLSVGQPFDFGGFGQNPRAPSAVLGCGKPRYVIYMLGPERRISSGRLRPRAASIAALGRAELDRPADRSHPPAQDRWPGDPQRIPPPERVRAAHRDGALRLPARGPRPGRGA